MATATELLDLAPGVGQRRATFTFTLTEAGSLRPLGDLHPDATSAPVLTHDVSRTVARGITGLVLDSADAAAVNVVKDRVTVAMIVGGETFPLGTYVFTDAARARTTAGRRLTGAVADLGFVVDQPTDATVGVAANTNVGTAIAEVLAGVDGLQGFTVEATAQAVGAPIGWAAGTNRGRILADLAALGGYFAPFAANDSQIRVLQAFDPAELPPTFTFGPGGRVIDNTVTESDDLLDAPNRFVVIDNANPDAPIVGTYDVPVTAPHSAANRGFVVADVRDVQGLGTAAAADAAARAAGLATLVYATVTLSTPPDPRHDGYDIVGYDGANWLETAWSLPLVEGSEMSHTIQRAYRDGQQ